MKLFNNQTYLVSSNILYCVGFYEMSIFQRKPLPRVVLSGYHVFNENNFHIVQNTFSTISFHYSSFERNNVYYFFLVSIFRSSFKNNS